MPPPPPSPPAQKKPNKNSPCAIHPCPHLSQNLGQFSLGRKRSQGQPCSEQRKICEKKGKRKDGNGNNIIIMWGKKGLLVGCFFLRAGGGEKKGIIVASLLGHKKGCERWICVRWCPAPAPLLP